MRNFKHFATLTSIILFFAACSSDDDLPEVINDEETITTVKLTLTTVGSGETQTVIWTKDNEETITLDQDSSYEVSIQFLDESDPNDVEDITEEVIEEKDEHFVYFETTTENLTIQSSEEDVIDSNNKAINLITTWQTPAVSSTGIVKAFLIHEPLTKTGEKRDDFGGETDIEVSFDVVVQ
ncbi:hypothetical protein ACE939_13675 [Aquimarina sp. W85]|uniref:hypothetical protein n=1 Tax=Aquimarina rhodophyticola TaxID=3342246 RepID=UPI0036704889